MEINLDHWILCKTNHTYYSTLYPMSPRIQTHIQNHRLTYSALVAVYINCQNADIRIPCGQPPQASQDCDSGSSGLQLSALLVHGGAITAQSALLAWLLWQLINLPIYIQLEARISSPHHSTLSPAMAGLCDQRHPIPTHFTSISTTELFTLRLCLCIHMRYHRNNAYHAWKVHTKCV